MQKEIQKSRSAWEDFARLALATTSLSLSVGGMAGAATITEGTSPAPVDFPNVTPGYLLPVGTTTVLGHLNSIFPASDPQDWFEFQGLQPGQAFSMHGQVTGSETGTTMFVFNSSNALITSQTVGEGGGRTAVGTIPSDGNLIVRMLQPGGNAPNYTIGLIAPLAPPPPPPAPTSAPAASPWSLSALGLGLALSGGLAWRSKRGAER